MFINSRGVTVLFGGCGVLGGGYCAYYINVIGAELLYGDEDSRLGGSRRRGKLLTDFTLLEYLFNIGPQGGHIKLTL